MQPILLTFTVITIFVGLYSEGYDRLSEAHFINQFNFPDYFPDIDPIVFWFAMMRVCGIVFSLSALEIVKKQVKDNYKNVKLLQAIDGSISMGLLVFAFSKNFYLSFITVLLIDTLRSLTGPLIGTVINRYVKSNVRATMLSMMSQLDAFGQMIDGPFVGFIGNRYFIRTALVASSILLMPVLPFYQKAFHQIRTVVNGSFIHDKG